VLLWLRAFTLLWLWIGELSVYACLHNLHFAAASERLVFYRLASVVSATAAQCCLLFYFFASTLIKSNSLQPSDVTKPPAASPTTFTFTLAAAAVLALCACSSTLPAACNMEWEWWILVLHRLRCEPGGDWICFVIRAPACQNLWLTKCDCDCWASWNLGDSSCMQCANWCKRVATHDTAPAFGASLKIRDDSLKFAPARKTQHTS
jgi:hypothetical protein